MEDFDVITQQDEIARRRKLLNAMQQQSSEAPIVGNTGLGQALAKIATAYITSKGQGKLAEQETANRAAYGQQLGGEVNAYMDRSQGRAGDTMDDQQAAALMQNDVAPQLAEPVAANPREAIIRAMTSKFPEMQTLGKAGMTQLGKQAIDPMELLKLGDFSPESRVAAALSGKFGGLQGKRDVRAINGQLLVDVAPAQPQQVGDFRDTYKPPVMLGGAVVQEQEGTGKVGQVVARPPITTTNVTVSGQKAGFDEWSKLAAKTVGDLSEQARSSVKMLGQLNQLDALSDSGTMNGPLANPAVWLGELASSAGIPITKETAARLQNSETFGNTAAELWLATMNANGGSRGLVKEESERIARNLPSLLQTPEGRKQVIAVMRQGAQQTIADAKTSQQEFGTALQSQNPAAFTYGLSNTQLPNTAALPPALGSVAPNGGGVRNWKDYLGGQ